MRCVIIARAQGDAAAACRSPEDVQVICPVHRQALARLATGGGWRRTAMGGSEDGRASLYGDGLVRLWMDGSPAHREPAGTHPRPTPASTPAVGTGAARGRLPTGRPPRRPPGKTAKRPRQEGRQAPAKKAAKKTPKKAAKKSTKKAARKGCQEGRPEAGPQEGRETSGRKSATPQAGREETRQEGTTAASEARGRRVLPLALATPVGPGPRRS